MKQLAKQQTFGVPSLEVASRIEDSDMVAALEAANYRHTALMRELERQFETKASELRVAYLNECAAAQGD
jgi:hypothetical protein